MADTTRAALVTGGSSGIGLALAHMLGQEGYALTVSARREDKLKGAAEELRAEGFDVLDVAANLGDEEEIQRVVQAHRERHGRLDVLVNNAGVGIGANVAEISSKKMDLQLDLNLRAVILFYRECMDMLRAAAAEHRGAQVWNTSSISGKSGEAWLSVYSASKAGVVGFTQAMNKELSQEGIRSTAFCPAFVDTPMTDFVKGAVAPEDMIQPEDIAELGRALLRLSPATVIPEIMVLRLGATL